MEELDILKNADYYKKMTFGDAEGYLIINKKMKDYPCLFGFINMPDDKKTAAGLFAKLEDEAKKQGYRNIVGPVNYCTWMSYRWCISNFDFRLCPDCDNPPYYPEIIKKLGYRELYTYRSAVVSMNNPICQIGKSAFQNKLKEGYTFKIFEKDDIYPLARVVYDISTDTFAGSFLYSDISYEDFCQLYLVWTRKLTGTVIMAYKDSRPVGFVFGYDNPYQHNYIAKTSAVLTEYQHDKVYPALLYLGFQYVQNKGYEDMVFHFQCEQKKTFRHFAPGIESNEKRYAVYIKELSQ